MNIPGRLIPDSRNRFLATLTYGVIIAALTAASCPAAAQMELLDSSTLGDMSISGGYESSVSFERDVAGSDLGFLKNSVDINVPLINCMDDYDISLQFDIAHSETLGSAVLPDTGDAFPDDLYDLGVNLTARKAIGGGLGAMSVGIESSSDRPFDSADETFYNASLFFTHKTSPTDSWMYMLAYSSDTGFPLPGIAWTHRPSRQFALTLGVPFSMVYYRPLEKFDCSAQLSPFDSSAQLRYWFDKQLNIFGGYKLSTDSHARHNRADDDDRLSYFGNRLFTGIGWKINDVISVKCQSGWDFNSFYYEGEDYFSDRHDNRIDLDDGPFAELNISFRF